jgi:putative endonuclease
LSFRAQAPALSVVEGRNPDADDIEALSAGNQVPYYVYILSSRGNTLYTGMTNDLARRVKQHKAGKGGAFTHKYSVDRLVYYEEFEYVNDAIAREKQIKGWARRKKIELVESANPKWEDLSAGWFED